MTAWEIAFVLLLFAIILAVGRLAQVGGAMRRSRGRSRTVVREQPVAAAPAVPPVICPACQATNLGTNKFCSVCGATLLAKAPAPQAAEASPPPTSTPAHPSADTPSVLEGGPPAVAPGNSPTVPVNTCPSCATVNPPGQPFCGQCGTRLTTAAA